MNDINNFVPSLLNPRTLKNISLTQDSVASRYSLSLKKNCGLAKRNINQTIPAKKRLFASKDTENKSAPKDAYCAKSNSTLTDLDLSGYEQNKENNLAPTQLSFLNNYDLDTISTVNLSIDDFPTVKNRNKVRNGNSIGRYFTKHQLSFLNQDIADVSTVHLSSDDRQQFKDINSRHGNEVETIPVVKNKENSLDFSVFEDFPINGDLDNIGIEDVVCNNSLKSGSSATELYKCEDTITHGLNESRVSISFGVQDCDNIDLTTKNTNIKRVLITNKGKGVNLDCDIVACELSTESEYDENMNLTPPQKRPGIAVNLEIKKKKLAANESAENANVLILKTDAIERLSHVIVQPQNCKLVKRHLSKNKFGNKPLVGVKKYGTSDSLKQTSITSFFGKQCVQGSDVTGGVIVKNDASKMSRNIGASDLKCIRPYSGFPENTVTERSFPAETALKFTALSRCSVKNHLGTFIFTNRGSNKYLVLIRLDWKGELPSGRVASAPRAALPPSPSPAAPAPAPSSARPRPSHNPHSSAPHGHGHSHAAQSNSARCSSPLKESTLTAKTKSNRTVAMRAIPPYKIVAGTHFAVDAFSYGDIPNVKHYFLTHFHSDHYSGLKKNFSKLLYCSKITGDLCVSRLGVNPKCIHVLNLEETTRIEGVDVTAVDANHCPGAVMLFFCLPNGKTILHTGDFRASPAMESYPIFWNSDVHTIYLDTTYCNPRYDFPTQEQSLEMALSLLRAKKTALEKAGKKFSSVLIVCGTYTIGKEKFFLGMARRVGCSVWACPEKDKVLQAVEGRSFCSASAQSCQLHAVPMRDLTHEKLKSYLDSLSGAFAEVVAFKPSGWENGKNTAIEKDCVTIHGIPYSEHSSFSELIRFVNFLKPRQVIPTVDISGGIKAVQKYFPCPLVQNEDGGSQCKVTDYFSIDSRQQVPAVT